MKVIFIRDVGGAGRMGEVKEISDGYALNFLIPHGLAAQATKEALAAHEKRAAQVSAAKAQESAALAENIRSLEMAHIELKVRATEKGGLFKSIGGKEIVAACATQKGITLPESVVQLKKPIKETGEHTVILEGGGARASFALVVSAA